MQENNPLQRQVQLAPQLAVRWVSARILMVIQKRQVASSQAIAILNVACNCIREPFQRCTALQAPVKGTISQC